MHDDVRRFQEIWRDEFKEDLGDEDAQHHIARLDQLFLMLARRPKPRGAPRPAASEVDTHQ